jgi:hypothetical protein
MGSQLTSQLFFAIRGGGSNFGIVTMFQLVLHPIPPVCWSGALIFSINQLDDLVAAGVEWMDKIMSEDDSALMGSLHSPKDGSQVSLLHKLSRYHPCQRLMN